MIKETLRKLRDVHTDRCVSIFLPTHRTHPENRQDLILLRNLLGEAKERLIEECDSHRLPDMLSQLDEMAERIDPRYNLDGLAIFLNEDICEYVRLPIEVEPRVVLDQSFAIRDLLRALNQIEHYYILRLSEQEAHLFGAYTDRIIDEYIIHGFPYFNEPVSAHRHKEFLNRVDKGLQQVLRDEAGVVIIAGAARNYHYYMEVADRTDAIVGHLPGSWDELPFRQLAAESWKQVQWYIEREGVRAEEEIHQAISRNRLVTGLGEISLAIRAGRGETLFVEKSYFQPAIVEDDLIIPVGWSGQPGVVADIVDELIEDQMRRQGKVSFLPDGFLDEWGRIVLKTRY
jgi:hypothetical protein